MFISDYRRSALLEICRCYWIVLLKGIACFDRQPPWRGGTHIIALAHVRSWPLASVFECPLFGR
jgi:hypothetical protein